MIQNSIAAAKFNNVIVISKNYTAVATNYASAPIACPMSYMDL